MITKTGLAPRTAFFRTGRRILRASNGKLFHFQLHQDPMTRGMRFIQVSQEGKGVGHFDFEVSRRWLEVLYGTFATSLEQSYTEWAYSCLKDPAIEVFAPWGRHQKLLGMKIIRPNIPKFWKKFQFVWEDKDLVFYFASMRTPHARITLRR
jgi:hypothetical protein